MTEEGSARSAVSAVGAEPNSSRDRRGPDGRSCRVFLGVPHSSLVFSDSISSIVSASLGRHDVRIGMASSSLLCYNFNRPWADALIYSPRPDYFAMHHSDIRAPDGWVNTLIESLEQHGADMISAVVPTKTLGGHTSTAVVDLEGYRRRRLTVREVAQLPPVFDARMAGALYGVGCGRWTSQHAVSVGTPWVEAGSIAGKPFKREVRARASTASGLSILWLR